MHQLMTGRPYRLIGSSCVDFVAEVLAAGGIQSAAKLDGAVGVWDVTTIPNDYFDELVDSYGPPPGGGRP
jgi:hypothetical protein